MPSSVACWFFFLAVSMYWNWNKKIEITLYFGVLFVVVTFYIVFEFKSKFYQLCVPLFRLLYSLAFFQFFFFFITFILMRFVFFNCSNIVKALGNCFLLFSISILFSFVFSDYQLRALTIQVSVFFSLFVIKILQLFLKILFVAEATLALL